MPQPEVEVYSQHLLHDALHILGKWEVLENAQDKKAILSKFPRQPQTETSQSGAERGWASFEGEYITGVSGKATTYARGVVTNGKTGTKSTISIAPGDYLEIRYDYDTAKGSHANVKVGGKGEHKFAVMFPPGDHKRGFETAPGFYFDAIIDQSSTVGFCKGMDDASLAYCAAELAKVYYLKTQDSCSYLQCGGSL